MDSYFLFLQVWRADRLLARHVKLSKNVLFVEINKTEPQSVKRVVWLWQTASEFDSILSKNFGAVGTPESQSVTCLLSISKNWSLVFLQIYCIFAAVSRDLHGLVLAERWRKFAVKCEILEMLVYLTSDVCCLAGPWSKYFYLENCNGIQLKFPLRFSVFKCSFRLIQNVIIILSSNWQGRSDAMTLYHQSHPISNINYSEYSKTFSLNIKCSIWYRVNQACDGRSYEMWERRKWYVGEFIKS